MSQMPPNTPELKPDASFGEATQPKDGASIMKNMLSQVVTLEDIAAGKTTHQEAPKPVALTEPKKVVTTIQPQIPGTEKAKVITPDVNLFTDEPEEVPVEAAPDEEPDMSDIPDDPKTENWKKAREALKTERKTLKTLTKEFETTKNKLEKYEKGEIIPEIITAKDTRISQLEKFETIVNGKLSDEYDTLVTKPVKIKSDALHKLANDYQVPENIREQLVRKIVETENERERNKLITEYFPDAIGATKVENLVKDLHSLGQVALDMDNKPTETLQNLQTQYQAKKQKEAETIAGQFEHTGKSAWSKALDKTANEGIYSNLIMDPTNSEHSSIAEKNQHRAGIQYGALLKKLHENGLKTLPEDLAIGLARSVQLSIGGVGAYKQLAEANKLIADMQGSNGMMATYLRPGMNSNGQRSAAPVSNDRGPASPKDAAQQVVIPGVRKY